MDEHQLSLGERLRLFRLRAGMSQAALAEHAGLTTAAVAALERGLRRSPYARTLGALAEALQLSTEERTLFTSTARAALRVPSAVEEAQAKPAAPCEPRPPRSALIGREHDVARIRALLAVADADPPTRLVTLTGIGGVGKTSLARAVANELRSNFEDRVWLIELAHVVEPSQVPAVLAHALGLPDLGDAEVVDAVAAFLRGRHALLILDNCEHLIDACAHVVDTFLDGCPSIRILTTSREPLLIRGEQQVRVQPLPAPEDADVRSVEELEENPAVQVLVRCAQAACPDFRLTAEVAPAIAQICIRLEGIPLALELAAASLTVLSAIQLVERLDDAFQVLGTHSRSTPTRQQTLRATLDWSYELLTPPEQALFRRLGVFVAGFSLEAAESICTDEDVKTADVLDLLARLVDKSLVMVQPAASARYRLVEPLRQYAFQCLAARGETAELEERHTAYYLALAEQAAGELRGPHQVTWLARLDRELDNLRVTLHRLASMDGAVPELRFASALACYCEARGRLAEGRRWLEHAIARARAQPVPGHLLRNALFRAGCLAQSQGDLRYSVALIEESLELSRALRDDGDLMRANRRLESGRALFSAPGDFSGQAMTLVAAGELALAEHKPAETRTYLLDQEEPSRCATDSVLTARRVTGRMLQQL